MGDMTSETGIAHEALKLSINRNLPIHFHCREIMASQL